MTPPHIPVKSAIDPVLLLLQGMRWMLALTRSLFRFILHTTSMGIGGRTDASDYLD